MRDSSDTARDGNDLERRLRAIGETHYHDRHPFHRLLHTGRLNKVQVQAWALNRYCYQAAIPVKDARLMSRFDDHHLRRAWRRRIADHDGDESNPGGIERWLQLSDGLGLDRAYVTSQEGALPASRFAAAAYIKFVSEVPLLAAIASSLTELFAPGLIARRTAGMLAHYDFISEEMLAYFEPRLTQAPQDADFALRYVLDHARSAEQQADVLNALRFKCDLLWSQLDALYYAYVEPGLIPPGCFAANE